jgi:hypothetical protein
MIRITKTEGKMPHYRKSDAANPYEAVIASFAVKVAVAELQITEPSLCFIQGTIASCSDLSRERDIWGLAWPRGKEIFIRSGLNFRDLAGTTFHECRHAQQFQRGAGFNRESNERDAQIYALEMMGKIGNPPEWRVLECLIKIANQKGL